MTSTPLHFAAHLLAAVLFGSLIGLERQWHQRMAGTRTNALVAGGAAAFVMAGLLLPGDSSAAGRVASYVVSGVGFLGAGVIFKDGANVRGLTTSATIWCSAAIGVLCGIGYFVLPLILMTTVLLTNTVLRPLAYRVHPMLPAVTAETTYAIVLTCRSMDETHLRPLLVAAINQAHAILQAIHSEDEAAGKWTRLRADVTTPGRRNEDVEMIAMRLSMEPGVTSLSWSIVQTAME
jgi:putative Mg2+ transporter-C (MgtC) family protein